MKKSIQNLFGFLLIATVVLSCSKQETKDYLESGTAPVLSTTAGSSLPLSFANADNTAFTLSWTNPNYKFTTGVSSQDVAYTLEIDTAGANFASPSKQSIGVTKDLGITFTVSQFNNYMLNELLTTGVPHNLEMRVKASLVNNTATLISNVLKLTVTPYSIPPKVPTPTTGVLYLVGSATAGGWNNPVPVPTQQFTQISPTLYQITVSLVGGQEYLLLPLNGDWTHKYAVPDKTVAGLNAGGAFGFDKSDNFPGPTASGTYKIQVNFQTGLFTVTKQ